MLGYPATRIFLKQPGHLVVPRPETQRENLTSALAREIFGLHPSFSRIDRRTTSKRIESYATVYHDVAQTFKNLMPAFLKRNRRHCVPIREAIDGRIEPANERGWKGSNR